MHRLLVVWAALGLLTFAPAALAQDPDPDPDPAGSVAPDPAGLSLPPTLHGELQLSLEEALKMAIENNLDVEIDRHDPMIAHEDAVAAFGVYDPEAFGSYTYFKDEQPTASALQNSNLIFNRSRSGDLGIRGLVPKLGWSYDIGWEGQSLRTNSSIQDLSPQYTQGLIGSINAPLLRGFLWSEPWFAVKSTRVLEGVALEDFRRSLMDIIRDIENGYWNLVATEEQLRVEIKSVETSEALLDQTNAQYEVGVVSRVEVVEAEAGVAEREVNRIIAENNYRAAQDELIDSVLGPNLTPKSSLEIRPSSRPDPVVYTVDAEEATKRAFHYRPELAAARQEVERQQIAVKFRWNQRLPQFDVVGEFGYRGLSGEANPAPPLFGGARNPDVNKGFWDSGDFFNGDDSARTFTAGAVVSIPLTNTKARAEYRRAQLQLRRTRTQLRRLEQSIVLEVRDAIRDLDSSQEGIEASERRRLAAEEQLRAEKIRLEHGESTPFDVLQRERDLVDAESQKIGALQTYRVSITSLDRSQGTLLRDRNILIEDAKRLR